ncbi:hypothetical protein BV898_13346 [Hypsibius exemplaris]|uniref:Uncharacterized protein n=1 Tax=Hypsibius exemplaris TaxID=2072580 RepID=A0A1W0WB57_HYPEX|nr:hypothetical protein BV898_13346 [Hypsibius exemplaris]
MDFMFDTFGRGRVWTTHPGFSRMKGAGASLPYCSTDGGHENPAISRSVIQYEFILAVTDEFADRVGQRFGQ